MPDNATRTLVVGSLGVIGRSVVEHLDSLGLPVVGLSRRVSGPDQQSDVPHLIADITDRDSIGFVLEQLSDITHLVFAAYQEHPSLRAQVAPNVALLSGALDALRRAGAPLQHVTLYQGNKFYGAHLGPFKTPARESDPRLPGPNFYYDQEDLLAARAAEDGFHFTLLRPEGVCGVAVGNPMNLLTALAVYATLCRYEGIPYRFTGPDAAADVLYQVCDARLLARATAWAGRTPAAWDEAFNITNGDVFRWREMSTRIAAYFGIDCAPAQQLKLADHLPGYEPVWQEIVARHGLHPVPYRDIAAWNFADAIFHSSYDNVSSTIKLRQAGFADCIDTGQMFEELFGELVRRRLIPDPARPR